MAIPGELTGLAVIPCRDCGILMENTVLRSNAGYYIGKACNCGPYSRESDYFGTWEKAQDRLDKIYSSHKR